MSLALLKERSKERWTHIRDRSLLMRHKPPLFTAVSGTGFSEVAEVPTAPEEPSMH